MIVECNFQFGPGEASFDELRTVKALGSRVGQDADFQGNGTLSCYGQMRVYVIAGSGDAECFPQQSGVPSSPQGYIMDGDSNGDGENDTHFVRHSFETY